MDITPALQERISCSLAAAAKYQVPAALLLAVADKEGGRPGLVVRNKNGTSDIGTMQFNTAYIATLAPYGIRTAHVALAGCYPFELAAWRLREHLLHDTGDIWTRAANYHSRTPQYNSPYRSDLIRKVRWWSNWLVAHSSPPQGTLISGGQSSSSTHPHNSATDSKGNLPAVKSDAVGGYVQRSIVTAPAKLP